MILKWFFPLNICTWLVRHIRYLHTLNSWAGSHFSLYSFPSHSHKSCCGVCACKKITLESLLDYRISCVQSQQHGLRVEPVQQKPKRIKDVAFTRLTHWFNSVAADWNKALILFNHKLHGRFDKDRLCAGSRLRHKDRHVCVGFIKLYVHTFLCFINLMSSFRVVVL